MNLMNMNQLQYNIDTQINFYHYQAPLPGFRVGGWVSVTDCNCEQKSWTFKGAGAVTHNNLSVL